MVKGNVKVLEGSLNKIEELQGNGNKRSKNFSTSKSNGNFRK